MLMIMAYRLSFVVVPRSINSRTSLLLQHHEAVELQQAAPCNLVDNIDIQGLLTKCLWTKMESRSIKTQKTNDANIQSYYTTKLVQPIRLFR